MREPLLNHGHNGGGSLEGLPTRSPSVSDIEVFTEIMKELVRVQPGRVSDGGVGWGTFIERAGGGGIKGSRRKVAWLASSRRNTGYCVETDVLGRSVCPAHTAGLSPSHFLSCT